MATPFTNRFGKLGVLLVGLSLCAIGAWWSMRQAAPSVDSLRQLCRSAHQAKDWERLRQESERWSRIDPTNSECRFFQAEALDRTGHGNEALAALRQVPANSPQAMKALSAQVEMLFGSLNRPREGAATCETILERDPRSQMAQQRLIFYLTMTVQRPRLIRQIRSAFEAGTEPPESYVYLFLADALSFANGAELNARWSAGGPDAEVFEVAQAIFIAESLDGSVSLDDRDAALAAYRALAKKHTVMDRLLEKYPHNPELLAYHLRECVLTGKVERAVELLAQAPKDAEGDNRFWRYKGWVHAQWDEFDEAGKAYRKALELHPVDWTTRHLLADLKQRQGAGEEVKTLRSLVDRANALRREVQAAPSARQVPRDVLSRLAEFAADCGDPQFAKTLRKRISGPAESMLR